MPIQNEYRIFINYYRVLLEDIFKKCYADYRYTSLACQTLDGSYGGTHYVLLYRKRRMTLK